MKQMGFSSPFKRGHNHIIPVPKLWAKWFKAQSNVANSVCFLYCITSVDFTHYAGVFWFFILHIKDKGFIEDWWSGFFNNFGLFAFNDFPLDIVENSNKSIWKKQNTRVPAMSVPWRIKMSKQNLPFWASVKYLFKNDKENGSSYLSERLLEMLLRTGGKHWPIADRRVPSSDSRSTSGTHFGCNFLGELSLTSGCPREARSLIGDLINNGTHSLFTANRACSWNTVKLTCSITSHKRQALQNLKYIFSSQSIKVETSQTRLLLPPVRKQAMPFSTLLTRS